MMSRTMRAASPPSSLRSSSSPFGSAPLDGQRRCVDRGQGERDLRAVDSTTTPGCTVAASVKGQLVLNKGYGMADLEHGAVITPETIFEAGSVSKQFTAAAVLLLAREGKLSLDDPARKYVPELPDYGQPLTIRHMLQHTSGLRDWGSMADLNGWPRTTRAHTHAHVLDIASRQTALNFKPGSVVMQHGLTWRIIVSA
jgi:CubicO group peptidase (beta-lactamase class C family)